MELVTGTKTGPDGMELRYKGTAYYISQRGYSLIYRPNCSSDGTSLRERIEPSISLIRAITAFYHRPHIENKVRRYCFPFAASQYL